MDSTTDQKQPAGALPLPAPLPHPAITRGIVTSHHSSPSLYQPLPPSCIRLLTLCPSPTPSDPLTASLITVSLSNAPPYDAISYVWGDPLSNPGSVSISVSGGGSVAEGSAFVHSSGSASASASASGPSSGCSVSNSEPLSGSALVLPVSASPSVSTSVSLSVPATANLCWALRRLRRADEPRVLWADALCINQAEDAERSSQVALMGRIYGGAVRVMACVGPDDGHSGGEGSCEGEESNADRVASLLEKYLPIMQGGTTSWRSFGENDPDVDWAALRPLLGSRWFSRAWVLQEVGLAQEPVVVYGRREFGYRDLMYVVRWINRHALHLVMRHRLSSLFIHTLWTDWGVDGWVLQRARGDGYKLLDLLDHAALLDCSDPRDRVYAFLGHPLATRRVMVDGKVVERVPVIVPDYSKGVLEVYKEATELFVRDVGVRALAIVEHDEDTIEDVSVPSWVIRWNVNRRINNIYQHPSKRYSACGRRDGKMELLTDDQTMKVPGVVVDSVAAAFRMEILPGRSQLAFCPVSSSDSDEGLISLEGLIQRLEETATPFAERYFQDCEAAGRSEPRASTLGLTLCSAMLDEVEDGDLGDFDAFRKMQQKLSQESSPLSSIAASTRVATASASAVFSSYQDDDGEELPDIDIATADDKASRFWFAMKFECWGRSFFVTSKGYYGMADWVVRPGDECAVFDGGKVPFVLRRRARGRHPGGQTDGGGGSEVRLVSEAYLHGFMNGEALEQHEEGDLTEETFEIW